MDLFSWCEEQTTDRSPVGRLISICARRKRPETFLRDVILGYDDIYPIRYATHAKSLLREFVRQGGRLQHPSWFPFTQSVKVYNCTVLKFERRVEVLAEQPAGTDWRLFYAKLLRIDLSEPAVEPDTLYPRRDAVIVRLEAMRNQSTRLKA